MYFWIFMRKKKKIYTENFSISLYQIAARRKIFTKFFVSGNWVTFCAFSDQIISYWRHEEIILDDLRAIFGGIFMTAFLGHGLLAVGLNELNMFIGIVTKLHVFHKQKHSIQIVYNSRFSLFIMRFMLMLLLNEGRWTMPITYHAISMDF